MPKTNPIDGGGGSGGGSVDLAPVETRLTALEDAQAGPLMVGVGENGDRDTALYLEPGPDADKALMTKGPDDIERPV